MVDWSKLPYDIVQMIAIRLDAVEDFVAFSAVCCSWRSYYLAKQWLPGSQVPWLMLSDHGSNNRAFYSLYRDKEYELELPEARGRRCWGSANGWIVTMDRGLEIHLLNVFTRNRIRLPEQSTFQKHFDTPVYWQEFIHKAIVINQISMENEEDLLVMAIYGPSKQLAFAKPGYSSWINVEESIQHKFIDVACLNDQIFALCNMGDLLVIDIYSQPPKIEIIASPPHQQAWERLFLVESSGDLLMVNQYLDADPYDDFLDPTPAAYHFLAPCRPAAPEIQFDVFQFDFGAKEWMQLEELGDRAIFLGDNYSMSAPPKFGKCSGNCIYFIVSKMLSLGLPHFRHCNSGVYDMANGIVRPFFHGEDRPNFYSCPIWVTPTIC